MKAAGRRKAWKKPNRLLAVPAAHDGPPTSALAAALCAAESCTLPWCQCIACTAMYESSAACTTEAGGPPAAPRKAVPSTSSTNEPISCPGSHCLPMKGTRNARCGTSTRPTKSARKKK